jgi:uncharacterized protein (DUF2252 family)
MARDVLQQILDYNQRFVGRDPDLLPHKLRKMAQSPFGYFRGTFHVFAADWVSGLFAPWRDGSGNERDPIIGDVHIEGFGTTRGADGTVEFGFQDFDEVAEGDYDLDVFRAAASAALAADQSLLPLNVASSSAAYLATGYAREARQLLDAPGEAARLAPTDPPETIVQHTASLAATTRQAFLERLVVAVGDKVQLKRDETYLAIRPERARAIEAALGPLIRQKQAGLTFLPADVAFRVSGTGGLGRYRYVVLLSPEAGEPYESIVLDVKEAIAAALDLHRDRSQLDQAAQVVKRMSEMQHSPNPWGAATRLGSQPFQVKEITPQDGHLSPSGFTDARNAESVLEYCGRVLARAHQRAYLAAPRERAAPPGERLRDREGLWVRRVVSFGLFYAALVQEDHRNFTTHLEELMVKLSPGR